MHAQIIKNRNSVFPSIVSNLWSLYNRDKSKDGTLILDHRVAPFLRGSLLTGMDAEEGRQPSIGWFSKHSMIGQCMKNDWIKKESGLFVTDTKLSAFVSEGYLVAVDGHMHCDIIEAETMTPAFGKITLSYYRTIVPVRTLTGKACLLAYCHPIGHLGALLSQDTRYLRAN